MLPEYVVFTDFMNVLNVWSGSKYVSANRIVVLENFTKFTNIHQQESPYFSKVEGFDNCFLTTTSYISHIGLEIINKIQTQELGNATIKLSLKY